MRRSVWISAATALLVTMGSGLVSPGAHAEPQVPRWRLVTAGPWHTCGIQSDSSLWCWGEDDRGEVGNGPGNGIVSTPEHIGTARWATASVNQSYSCGIHADRGLYCWGDGVML